ncbi:unnamed protein product [Lepeophtheirus salmonis]|uniref:(salmon louse) hypothetical protein n=1 Tax=Lepeophtheirus salmonis TaxID=72036 RepID=A0A817FG38_LEPSM|nr:unnamed protein product [Lepeophtheirus salmonis]
MPQPPKSLLLASLENYKTKQTDFAKPKSICFKPLKVRRYPDFRKGVGQLGVGPKMETTIGGFLREFKVPRELHSLTPFYREFPRIIGYISIAATSPGQPLLSPPLKSALWGKC